VLLLLAQVSPVNSFIGVRQYLRELDYIDGRNIIIQEQVGRLSELPAELVRRKVDVIHAISPPAIRAAWESANGIPIVGFDYETDPLHSGYVQSFARPGGKLTGIFLDQPELGGKWLQILNEVAPGLSHVAAVWDVETGTSQLEGIRHAARKLGIRLDVFEFNPNLQRLFRDIATTGAKALILLSSPSVANQSDRLAVLARAAHLPSISLFRHFVQGGRLLSYGPDGREMRQRAGGHPGGASDQGRACGQPQDGGGAWPDHPPGPPGTSRRGDRMRRSSG
jgi:putative ABC transport system substrate-binding protein